MTRLDALSPRWPEISALLDEALTLPPAERPAWLDALDGPRAGLRDTLRALLAARGGAETDAFLATLPPLETSAEHADEPAAGMQIGPYRLLAELGRGGMGAVWLAERSDGQMKRKVALKLPRLAWGGALAERLAREREILAALEHPHIARLYDAGVDARGRPYLALEYVEGEPIDVHCRRHELAAHACVALLLQVCAAVAHAHARLVVHRDLKPANILVDADGQVHLLDFGIAKLMEGDRTAETALTQLSGHALTLDYASPEQIRGEPLGTASDVYSLAVVAYELLAGERPYRLRRGSAAELEEAIAAIDPPLASTVAPDAARRRALRGDLDAILNKALKKNPAERYPTVEQFAQDLQRHLGQLPVHAQPDRLGYRVAKFMRRHRLQVGAGALVAGALLAGAGVSAWQAQRAIAEANRANEVKRFVLSLFSDADTGAGGNRSTTALQLLQRARDRLAGMKNSDPAVSAELLKAVADSLLGLGEYDLASSVLGDARGLAVRELGPDHVQVAEVDLALGEARMDAGDLVGARTHLDAAERGLRRHGDTRGLMNTLRWQSVLRGYTSRFDEAVAAAQEALELAETLPATDRRSRMLAHQSLAATLTAARRPGRVEAARKAYDLAREIHGDRPVPDVLSSRSQYAFALVQEGDSAAGVAELRALLPQQIALLGARHNDVLRTLGRIANASLELGDTQAAVGALDQAIDIQAAMDGGRPTTDLGLFHLVRGAALLSARRLDDAAAAFDRAAPLLEATQAPDSGYMRRLHVNRLLLLLRQDRLDAAEALAARALATPAAERDRAGEQLRIALLRSRQGRHAEALAEAEAGAAWLAREPRRADAARALLVLGEVRLAAGQPAEALVALEQGDRAFASIQPAVSHDRADLLVATARARLALGLADAALDAATAAATRWLELDPGNRHTGLALLWLGRAQHAAGRTAEAAATRQRAAALLATTGRPGDRILLGAAP